MASPLLPSAKTCTHDLSGRPTESAKGLLSRPPGRPLSDRLGVLERLHHVNPDMRSLAGDKAGCCPLPSRRSRAPVPSVRSPARFPRCAPAGSSRGRCPGVPDRPPACRCRCRCRAARRSEEHTSELQSRGHLVCRLLLEKKKKKKKKKLVK